jgi:lipid A 3-O-deacylase
VPRRRLAPALALTIAVVACAAHAEDEAAAPATPQWAFGQVGSGSDTAAVTAGLTWELPYEMRLGNGRVSTRVEAAIARWRVDAQDRGGGFSWFTQAGITPALRWQPALTRWFFELGVGATAVWPRYRSEDRQFSTTFNFGDQLAVGRCFGAGDRHEVSLRLQHFSNGGVRRPNPGADFVQLRYSIRIG